MCRFAAYLGTPQPASRLLFDTDHALERQAHAPQEQLSGTVNADGTGLAWWPPGTHGPHRYATTLPPWADENLRELAPLLQARAMIAAVRGATPGVPGGRGAVAPFVVDDLAIAHNGWIDGFRDGMSHRLISQVPAHRLAQAEVLSDSALIALLVAEARATTDELAAALTTALRQIATTVSGAGRSATLNVVGSDGHSLVAARASVEAPCNSLYFLDHGQPTWPDGVVVASEPLGDGSWKPVPESTLLVLTPDECHLLPLELGATT